MEVDFLPDMTRFILVILFVSIILLVRNWKQMPQGFKVLSVYLFWNLLIEMVVLSLPKGTNNLPLLHLHTVVEFVLFSFLYREIGLFDRLGRQGFFLFSGGVILLLILNSVFLQDIYSYNSYAKTLVQVCLIIFALAYLFEFREKSKEVPGFSYVNSAILIYYSGSLFVFMFGNALLGNKYNDTFWFINSLLNLAFQILILIGIWTASRGRKLQSL